MQTNTIWQDIREQLAQQRQLVIDEIRHYPAPIPACDVQFNHLMQQRATITRELGRLDAAAKLEMTDAAKVNLLDEFVSSSLCLDDAAKATLHDSLHAIISA